MNFNFIRCAVALTFVVAVVTTGLSELRFRWRKPEVPPEATFKPDAF